MSELTRDERAFLLEQQTDPRWASILNKLRRQSPALYKPGDAQEAFHEWIYESARKRENDEILNILSMETNHGR